MWIDLNGYLKKYLKENTHKIHIDSSAFCSDSCFLDRKVTFGNWTNESKKQNRCFTILGPTSNYPLCSGVFLLVFYI